MSVKIVCVGGTGQMVLQYYLQMYFLGLVPDPFDAVVLDTDDIGLGIRRAEGFLTSLQYGTDANAGYGGTLATVRGFPLTESNIGDAHERLTGTADRGATVNHPIRAFFDEETLLQNLQQGLYARPALSSVISLDRLSSEALSPGNADVIVVVGSVIGGTGGGLLAPVMDEILKLARRENRKISLRAVIFGRYFSPDPGRLSGDVSRFDSNEILVLRSIREALGDLDLFYIVRPDSGVTFSRQPDQEKAGNDLPWPEKEEAYHPFWEGTLALEYLARETVSDRRTDFEQREVVEMKKRPFTLAEATQRLDVALNVSNRLVGKEVVPRLLREPWLPVVWGRRLPRYVAHFWRIAAHAEKSADRAADFPARVQTALEALWRGGREEPGLRYLWPPTTLRSHVRPRSLATTPWPEPKEANRSAPLFPDVETTAKRAAANLLFRCLREGR